MSGSLFQAALVQTRFGFGISAESPEPKVSVS